MWEMVAFFQGLEPTMVGIEACGGGAPLGPRAAGFGHQVKLLPPKYAKAYGKRGKNDAADAEALCEAMSRSSSPPRRWPTRWPASLGS
jgi:transposase